MAKAMPPQPTAAEKAASAKYRAGLKKVKVSPAEGRVIESANRSEGGDGMKKGGMMKKATKAGRAMTKKSADTMGRAMVKKAGGGKCYAKGGTASARADGVAKKGKTHTEMVKMARGGMMSKMTPRTEYGGVEKAKGGKVKKMAMGGPADRAIGRMVAKQNAPAMAASAPKPSNMGANMMRRKKGGKC